MPRVALTDEQIRTFRARAVEAATRLFAREGYDAVTMRELAAELGVSPMTPYRYFEGKDDLFVAVRTAAFRRFADTQRDAYDGTPKPLDRVRALQRAYVAFALSEPDAYRIMFELAQKPAGEHPELDAEAARSFSYLHRAVDAAVKAKLLSGDPLTRAHLAWAAVHGIVSLHLAGKLALGRSLEELNQALAQQLSNERNRR